MSYYYNYYIGYLHEGKIYPWGPYTAKNKLKPIICRPSFCASNLHDSFYRVQSEQVSDELRAQFEEQNWKGETSIDVKYLPVDQLPTGNYIKTGYYLISEVQAYQSEHNFDCFSESLSPEIYAVKLQNEMILGKNPPKKDSEGYEYTESNASDYMYFAYPDYGSEEYEAFILDHMVDMMKDYPMPKDDQYVILETEG